MVAGLLIAKGLVLSMFGITIYFQTWVVVLITLAAGVLFGALNGIIITRFNVPPFIATLGAAELSGVKISRVKLFVYMLSGFCSAIGGLVITSQLVASHPATGTFFELNAIAAAVLGGTSLAGGRGTIGGTIIGAFVIGVLRDGLVMMGVSSFWQQVIKGVVIILAIMIDQLQRNMQQKAALEAQQ